MAHSWESPPIASEPPKPRRLAWRPGWASASIASIGVALRFGTVVLVCVVVGGFVANSAPEPPQLQRPVPEPVLPPGPAAPLLGPAEVSSLLSPNGLNPPISSQGLVADDLPRLDPASVCELIGVEGGGTAWAASLVFPGEWECLTSATRRTSKRSSRREAAKADAGPLFAMARGVSEDGVSYLRLKISGTDAATTEAAATVLSDRMTALFREMNWPLPERVPLSVRLLHPFESQEGGTTIRFLKERLEDWHYNLIVTLPRRKAPVLSGNYRDLVLLSEQLEPSLGEAGAPH